MCGISGIVNTASTQERLLGFVRCMGSYLHHRGPDAWGEWSTENVALGHNRLSILDLEGGAQPMRCSSGRHVIVFNGEIYNFREIRKEILAAGGQLLTDHSDTEAIVAGYDLWGEGIFQRLDGMFACAIWTVDSRRLVLARDRLGIKPVYFCQTGEGGFAFASEPKALVGARLIEPRLDAARLPEYFLFRAPLHPGTMFTGMQALEPGHLVRFDAAKGQITSGAFTSQRERDPQRQQADADEIHRVLDQAVRSHLVADVEVGVFLSGGVDSSLVLSMAAQHQRINAFNVSTGGADDELEFAQQVATHVGAKLHSRRISPDQMLAAFDDWGYFNDDPVADPSALALMMLAEDVHERGLKVMLSGEGADELFGGYRSYQRFLVSRTLTSLLGKRAAMLGRLGDSQLLEYLQHPDIPFQGTAHLTTRSMRQSLLGTGGEERLQSLLRGSRTAAGPLRQALLVDQQHRLPSDLLMRTDRATMAWSVEARVPLLANGVLAASQQLRDRDLCTMLPPRGKPLLKRLAARRVPPGVVYRKKIGFDLPLREWLTSDFKPRLDDMLTERMLAGIDYEVIKHWRSELGAGSPRLAGVLWAWLVLETWYRKWIVGSTPPRFAVAHTPSDREGARA